MMRSLPLAALALCCLAAPALAVDSGLEVKVYPVSASGREVLLYPGGQYMRVVPALREPGDTGAPIRLHMPTRRARVARVAPAEAAAPPVERPRPAPVERPRPAPKVAAAPPAPKVASAAPAPATPYGAGPGAAGLFGNLPTISAAPAPQTASAAPPSGASSSGSEGLAKQGVILFAHDADSPADTALDSIRLLAGQLNNGMTRTQSRVELMAYGGNKGDKGSDARRLSLKRALAIRQVLIDAGVSSARIDVHAQGGVDDTGPTDRVDVFIRA